MDYFEVCQSDFVARMRGNRETLHALQTCLTLFFSGCHHWPLVSRVFASSNYKIACGFANVGRPHSSVPVLASCHLTSRLIVRHRLAGVWWRVVPHPQHGESECPPPGRRDYMLDPDQTDQVWIPTLLTPTSLSCPKGWKETSVHKRFHRINVRERTWLGKHSLQLLIKNWFRQKSSKDEMMKYWWDQFE